MANERSGSGSRVLLVDDEFSTAEVLALLLAGEGFHVTTAANGAQALERLEEAAPDLLVADFMMPGMNGAQLIRMSRALPRYESLPVLLISGAPETALRRYDVKYETFLRKPFSLESFLNAVRRLRD